MKQLRLKLIVATVGGPRQVATDLRFWELISRNKFKELMTDKAY